MKTPINLASQPYENLRPLYVAAGAAAVLLAALILVLAWNARQTRNETRMLTEQTDRIAKELADLRREEGDLTKSLSRPEVQEIRERSDFLNSLIARKSLSWTRMFMDLEKVLPERVQITSIRPGSKQSSASEFSLLVSSPTVQPLVELLKNLEAAPQFGSPVVESQRFPTDKATDPNIVLDLSVGYHQSSEVPSPSQEETKKEAVVDQPAAIADAAGAQKGGR